MRLQFTLGGRLSPWNQPHQILCFRMAPSPILHGVVFVILSPGPGGVRMANESRRNQGRNRRFRPCRFRARATFFRV